MNNTLPNEAPNPDAGGSYVRNPVTGELSPATDAQPAAAPPAQDELAPARPARRGVIDAA